MIAIRQANLDSDRGILIEAIRRWIAPQSDERRFDWLYRSGPHGQASAWIATHGSAGPLVGAAAAFPRRMFVGSAATTGCVLGDFFIVPEYRSLGPAVQLQRACLAGVAHQSFEFGYDFPAATMLPVYKRLAKSPEDTLVRLAKPLRADRKIRERVKMPFLAKGLTRAANTILESFDGSATNGHACEISLHEASCGEEFTTLAATIGSQYGICTERSADYLNWRYRHHFARRYEFLTARRQNRLLAYLIYEQDSEDAEISDLFGINEPTVLTALVSAVVARLRQSAVVTLSAALLASHPWVPLFQKLGFRERDSCPVITHHAGNGNSSPNAQHWFLMQGDRES
jgi:GNAT superfamily N-acetyltransferase